MHLEVLLPDSPFYKAFHLPPLLLLPCLIAPHCWLHLPSPSLNTNTCIFLRSSNLQLSPGYFSLFQAMTLYQVPSPFLPAPPTSLLTGFGVSPPNPFKPSILGKISLQQTPDWSSPVSLFPPTISFHNLLETWKLSLHYNCLQLLQKCYRQKPSTMWLSSTPIYWQSCDSSSCPTTALYTCLNGLLTTHLFCITPIMMSPFMLWIPLHCALQMVITMQY